MTLAAGTRLGPYEVTAPLGAGGMGEVYRATDMALKRQVAIKVLPEALAGDADRLARFQREAEVLASLNHPNIAHIYGIEASTATKALVLELVEGPTLADRIAEGPIPVEEALPIAKQIAEALEAAHEQGVIHRDLKPANIKVRPDGTVKVLDFGLAKAMEPAGVMASSHSRSPTITTPAMTQAGMILGTAAYMSPEQAKGRPADKQSDIWAFGCVLYEMLTGARAFAGEDVAETLAEVLRMEPAWAKLPSGLSPSLGSFLKRCLQRDPKQRLGDMRDMRLALEGAFDVSVPSDAPRAQDSARPFWSRSRAGATAALSAVLVSGLAVWILWPAAEPRVVTRFELLPPEGQAFPNTQRSIVAISPNGRSVVYQTADGFYLRVMGDLEARLITKTRRDLGAAATFGGTASPFFSADGQWVGYLEGAQLMKIAVGGGAPVMLCDASTLLGASWAADNTILFGQTAGIMRVSASGGAPDLVIKAGEGEELYGPELLPGGNAVLFSVTTDMRTARWDRAQVVVQPLSGGPRTVVVERGSDARYLSTGHLVYALGEELFGVAFDLNRLAVTGGAVPLVQGVQRPVGVNAAGSNYAVSDTGTLVYLAGAESSRSRSLVWRSRDGSRTEPITSIPAGNFEDPRLSPDGSRVLVTLDGDIWIYDLADGRRSRVTFDRSSLMGVWDPTGARVAYSSAAGGNLEAWVAPSDGSGQARQLTRLGGQVHVDSWSPDGKTLSLHHHPADGRTIMYMLSMEQDTPTPRKFIDEAASQEGAHFSRDGRYVAYISAESGQREIYIRPYPGPGGRTTVSAAGGRESVWAGNGEVFYRSLAGERMFAVSVATAPMLKVGIPVQLFDELYYVSPTGSPRPQYDVAADAQRFLMLTAGPDGVSPERGARLVVAQNWTEELRRLVPR